MTRTKIEWADRVWNPVRGCSRVDLIPEKLAEPLSWRKPARVCVNSMSDLFYESLKESATFAVFTTMCHADRHTFLVLTKRPARMRALLTKWQDEGLLNQDGSVLPNVWLGVSVEDQESADERIPHLLATPAAKRFVSYEPALGAVDFTRLRDDEVGAKWNSLASGLDWIIVGGESGPGARPCDVGWIRSVVEQCKGAGVPCFVKQLGARPIARGVEDMGPAVYRAWDIDHAGEPFPICGVELPLRSRKGSDPSEWPEDLRVREWPDRASDRNSETNA